MDPNDPTLTFLPSPSSGAVLVAGKYRIVGKVGQGGMGVVYRAVDQTLRREVALKFIPPELASDPAIERRFLREAQAASSLDHENIGTIFGVENAEDGRRVIVMAYYEGRNLAQLVRERGALPLNEALAIAIQVARGLEAAHRSGVTHRDIKPSNVVLTTRGIVKIVDFGLASMAGAEQLSLTGEAMGTPAYMSPEQLLGKPVDGRTDVWSLGVVLLEMLTGQWAFRAESPIRVLQKVVSKELPLLDAVSPAMRPVVARALAFEAADRYQSASEFLEAMEALAQPAAEAPASPPRRRAPARKATVAAALVAVLALVWIAAIFWPRDTRRDAPAAPATPYAQYLQGLELIKRWDKAGNLPKAEQLFRAATKAEPKSGLAFARLAEAQRLQYALSLDAALLDSAAKNAEHALRLNPELAPVQVTWGRIQSMRGHHDVALASFERALKADPNDADAHQALARVYTRLGRFDEAEQLYRRAISLEPDSIAPHDSYANFLYRRNRLDDAIREFGLVVKIAPDHAAAHVNLGSALSDAGRIDEAIQNYRRAVELNPTYMAYSNLGTAYSRTGQYKDAVDAYRRALALSGNDPMVWGNLGFVYSWLPDSAREAREAFTRAIKLAEDRRKESPRDVTTHTDLALYYAKTGNAKLAGERLETALTLAPREAAVHAAATEVHELTGDRAKALEFAASALKLGYSRERMAGNPELKQLMTAVQ
ncbi:MAG: tetratricopeptide repeat protein [Bryobacteraceae bacterium]|nr:tetratricopeptide repeat protein [Bryobacteraceae bacterium]